MLRSELPAKRPVRVETLFLPVLFQSIIIMKNESAKRKPLPRKDSSQ